MQNTQQPENPPKDKTPTQTLQIVVSSLLI